MSFGYLLAWMVLFSASAVLYQTLRHEARHNLGWIAVHLLTIVATVLLILFDREWSGYIALEIWLLLVIVPTACYRRVVRLMLDGELKRARRLSYFVAAVHPLDGWRHLPRVLRALETNDGTTDEILLHHAARGNALARVAYAQRLTLASQWAELVAWVRAMRLDDFRVSATLFGYYLRALGETGEVNALVETFSRNAPWLETVGTGIAGQCRLFLYAFTGRPAEVAFLAESDIFPVEVVFFWLATAQMAAGRLEESHESFRQMLGGNDTIVTPRTKAAIEKRLANGVALASEKLSPENNLEIDRLTKDWGSERKYRTATDVRAGGSYATYAIIAVNTLVFLLEIRNGGSTDLDVLDRMGALTFEPGVYPEFWRLLAACFLHHGWEHLFTNMLGVYFLGPFVERALGHFKYAALYVGAGMLSMMIVSIFIDPQHVRILVGASGSVMALAGATAAILLRVWRHSRNRVAERRFRLAVMVVVLQSIFDLWTPEVSMTAHLGGAVSGFFIALAMRPDKELI